MDDGTADAWSESANSDGSTNGRPWHGHETANARLCASSKSAKLQSDSGNNKQRRRLLEIDCLNLLYCHLSLIRLI